MLRGYQACRRVLVHYVKEMRTKLRCFAGSHASGSVCVLSLYHFAHVPTLINAFFHCLSLVCVGLLSSPLFLPSHLLTISPPPMPPSLFDALSWWRYTPAFIVKNRDSFPTKVPIVVCCKGIENGSLLTPFEILEEELPGKVLR